VRSVSDLVDKLITYTGKESQTGGIGRQLENMRGVCQTARNWLTPGIAMTQNWTNRSSIRYIRRESGGSGALVWKSQLISPLEQKLPISISALGQVDSLSGFLLKYLLKHGVLSVHLALFTFLFMIPKKE